MVFAFFVVFKMVFDGTNEFFFKISVTFLLCYFWSLLGDCFYEFTGWARQQKGGSEYSEATDTAEKKIFQLRLASKNLAYCRSTRLYRFASRFRFLNFAKVNFLLFYAIFSCSRNDRPVSLSKIHQFSDLSLQPENVWKTFHGVISHFPHRIAFLFNVRKALKFEREKFLFESLKHV